MVKPTKDQVLQMLDVLKKRNMPTTVKYFTIGMFKIALRKNFLSVDDIVEEFPELDRPVQFKIEDVLSDNKKTLRGVKSDIPKESQY